MFTYERVEMTVWDRQTDKETNKSLLYLTPYLLNPCFDSILSTFLTELILATSQREATGLQDHALSSFCTDCLYACLVGGLKLCAYIIFITPTLSSCLHRWNVLFRNPQLICSQIAICNSLTHSRHLSLSAIAYSKFSRWHSVSAQSYSK